MTKKDYIKIAEVIRELKLVNSFKDYQINTITNTFCKMLYGDNYRFDSERFIAYINKA